MTPKRKTWSYLTGERGVNRVRVFPHPVTGRLFLEFKDSGRKVRLALGHDDRAAAKAKADELAAELRRFASTRTVRLTLGTLFDKYLREVTPTKSVTTQAHDRRSVRLFLAVFGANQAAAALTRRDLERFIQWRRTTGDTRSGARKGQSIGPRVIGYDLALLRAILTWAVGAKWLDRHPLDGVKVPLGQHTPNSPVLSLEHYEAMLAVAPSIDPGFALALILARETGHRINAIRQLRWSDIDWTARAVHWVGGHDKLRFAHTTPLTPAALAALEAHQQATAAIGNAWVLPAPGDATAPVSRDQVRGWWQRGELLARIPPHPGRGWHSLRRAFATDLKHIPLVDLAALGGWKSAQTILKCYQKPDADTMEAALASRSSRAALG